MSIWTVLGFFVAFITGVGVPFLIGFVASLLAKREYSTQRLQAAWLVLLHGDRGLLPSVHSVRDRSFLNGDWFSHHVTIDPATHEPSWNNAKLTMRVDGDVVDSQFELRNSEKSGRKFIQRSQIYENCMVDVAWSEHDPGHFTLTFWPDLDIGETNVMAGIWMGRSLGGEVVCAPIIRNKDPNSTASTLNEHARRAGFRFVAPGDYAVRQA